MQWENEQLFFDGDDYFRAVVLAIEQARQVVYLESYIFDLDSIGAVILNTLENAVNRGVDVKVIVDGIGSRRDLGKLKKECLAKKIQLRVYHPLPFTDQSPMTSMWSLFRLINKRNHRKTIIIDETSAFAGSFNISQVHSQKTMGKKVWHDAAVYIQGKDVGLLSTAFIKAWHSSGIRLLDQIENLKIKDKLLSKLIRLNSRITWRTFLLNDLANRIDASKNKVLVTNAYFLPQRKIIKALCKAASRGAYVGLCIPDKSDVWIVKTAAKLYYSVLIHNGVHIFEYQPTILHSKTMLIDDWATVGSHNLNNRSFIHDLEVEVVISHPENVKKLELKWEEDKQNSKEIAFKNINNSVVNRFLHWFAFLFRYWI